MQVLLANKFLFEKGGAEKAMFQTAALLRRHGHGTRFFGMAHPRNLPDPDARHRVSPVDYEDRRTWMRLKSAARMLYSWQAARRLDALLAGAAIDLAHLHNIYHQLSPSILRTLRRRGIPTVMTLHDYKVVCGSYQMLAQGRPCEACAGGRHVQATLRRCVKDSLAASLLTTLEMTLHHQVLDLYGLVDVFIAPSAFLRDKVRQMGFDRPVVHLPNFVGVLPDPERLSATAAAPSRLVYVGRLGREKGLATLLDAVRGLPVKLRIVGEGPMREPLQALARSRAIANVDFTGHLSGQALQREVAQAMAVVVPSEWYENNPLAVIEAFALGKPVIGARIGGIPELVRHQDTGLLFTSGDAQDLAAQIEALLSRPADAQAMGRRARRLVETELSPERHHAGLMAIYAQASARHGWPADPMRDGRAAPRP